VRHVKFSPEEMAIDAADVDVSKKPRIVIRGVDEWKRFLSFKRGYVRLDDDVAQVFKDASSVNRALRKLLEAIPDRPVKRRKTG
jgi:hypothetical protein